MELSVLQACNIDYDNLCVDSMLAWRWTGGLSAEARSHISCQNPYSEV